MGSLGDNLLKLTEFPFSYSLIGLLALIFGKGLNLEEAPLDKLGPLLILMGFVATTLSITDPIGALQKALLQGYYGVISPYRLDLIDLQPNRLKDMKLFGHRVGDIPSTVVLSLSRNFQVIFKKDTGASYEEIMEIASKLKSLRKGTSETRWIVREIDRITAMVYFIIIVSLFISAEFLLTGFLDKFLVTFQGGNQTEGGGGPTTGSEGQKATSTGSDGISVNATMGTNATTNTTVGGALQARILIIVFSFITLGAICYMLYRRHSDLRSKAWTAFRHLVEMEAIKIEKERFDPILKDIEKYLSDGDWTMAEYWVMRVMEEYDELIEVKFVKVGKEVTKDETVEK